MAKKDQCAKFKKAPQAPRRFKSAYMFFSTEKHKSIRLENGKKLQTTDVAKMVSQAWKTLSPEEREEWEEMARRDKARYEVEKTMYTGPWKVPATKSRAHKDPNAPKRPMSAFLSYSNSKRAAVKASNPDIGNAEVSRILAKMWKEAPEEERKMHIEKEFGLRQQYKTAIAIWRKNADEELKAVRKKREDIALQKVDSPENYHAGTERSRQQVPPDSLTGPPGTPDDGAHTKSPTLSGGVGGCNPTVPYSSTSAHGMGHNASTGEDMNAPPHAGPYYGSYGSPGAVTVPVGGTPADPSAAYGMMQPGAYGDMYPPEYGGPAGGFEQGFDPSMVGFYGSYYPSAPHMRPNDPNSGMPWGGQYYAEARNNAAPNGPSAGHPYGGGY